MNYNDERYFIDSDTLSPEALERKHRIETDPSARTNHMEYMKGMEVIKSDIYDKVMGHVDSVDFSKYTARDVLAALDHHTCTVEDFKALLSPAAAPFLEKMAQKAKLETSKHFGNTVYFFTPLYIANYCENYCVYCGFNCYNKIKRMQLSMEQIEREMKIIADSGMEEVLILTGESRAKSSVEYIGEACKIAHKYFRMVGVEVYPMNTDEYKYLHECGVDYVTVFQETYDKVRYEQLHLLGHKRIYPYRFDSQERALMGGMRGCGFSALLGLSDFRKDALASALHVFYLQKKYPHAEMSLSCPRLRPIVNNDKINPLDVHEKELCQVLCAYRIFMPFVGITVSSRESKEFRNGIVKIAATKVSAGVSTGVGDHEEKYKKDECKPRTTEENARAAQTGGNAAATESEDAGGDEQFEINDSRSFDTMYKDISGEGLQPVLNDYLYV
ncbi:MAG: 2-iminoacetate synthase ThiH [Fibrobacter sp.]|nr:2-iminoacetate synthase ThiH [Fibrobacter sp.]